MIEESTDIRVLLSRTDDLWMEKQPKYITRVSLDFLRNDDSALEILSNIRRRLSRKTTVKTRLADRIDDKFFSETQEVSRMFNHAEIMNGFFAQSNDLFNYVWNYEFTTPTDEDRQKHRIPSNLLKMNYTREVFQRLSRGQFISGNSIDPETRAIYNDIEECQQEYEDYFRKIDFYLSAGDGFYYFSRKEPRVNIENKLQSLFSWIDYLDFLKTYDTAFDAGTQFSLAQMEIRLSSDIELKEKLTRLFPDRQSNRDKLEALASVMVNMGFAEQTNETEGRYQVTSAFHYIEQIISCINIDEEVKDEIPE